MTRKLNFSKELNERIEEISNMDFKNLLEAWRKRQSEPKNTYIITPCGPIEIKIGPIGKRREK